MVATHLDDDGDDTMLTDADRAAIDDEIKELSLELDRCCLAPHIARELNSRRRHLKDELQTGHRLAIDTALAYYDFLISPRPAELGGGWNLKLLEREIEVGGGVFPVVRKDEQAHTWWSSLKKAEVEGWLNRTKNGAPEEAYFSHLHDEAWHDAAQAAGEWLETRPPRPIT